MKTHLFNQNNKVENMNLLEKLDSHKLSLENISQKYQVSLTSGVDESFACLSLIKNGKNRLTQKRDNKFFKFIGYFFTGFCGLIWVAAIICILAWKPIGNPPDPTNLALGLMLIFVICIQAAFTAFQDFTSSKVMKSIKVLKLNY